MVHREEMARRREGLSQCHTKLGGSVAVQWMRRVAERGEISSAPRTSERDVQTTLERRKGPGHEGWRRGRVTLLTDSFLGDLAMIRILSAVPPSQLCPSAKPCARHCGELVRVEKRVSQVYGILVCRAESRFDEAGRGGSNSSPGLCNFSPVRGACLDRLEGTDKLPKIKDSLFPLPSLKWMDGWLVAQATSVAYYYYYTPPIYATPTTFSPWRSWRSTSMGTRT